MLGAMAAHEPNPFSSLQTTKHGETRIKNCVKYELGDGWRLVTQQTEKQCRFLFVGDHEDVDRWLDSHRGVEFAVKDDRPVLVPGVGDNIKTNSRSYTGAQAVSLWMLLRDDATDYLFEGMIRSVVRQFEELRSNSSSSQIEALTELIPDRHRAELVHRVFNQLLAGNVEGAQNIIDLHRGLLTAIDDIDQNDLINVGDGEDIRRLRIGSAEYEVWLKTFEQTSNWQDWFLYLHPEQENVVKRNYPGAAQLSGVSGSGKTCVAVRRALRLAEAAEGKVLLLTLNRSLAGLLMQLVDTACTDKHIRARIEVTSFFELAQSYLQGFEPYNRRLYSDVTWKLEEHVDEVFREYYRQWANNRDAAVMLSLHKSLTARRISGEHYIREEFDWIRSSVTPDARSAYLTIERKGRKVPITQEWRADVLTGLSGWERKMRDVGVIDYLGLTSALTAHVDNIPPGYSHIIVDEAQDFGTTELGIVRRLVRPGPNDIFLCGDIAQTILPKHRFLVEAGFPEVSKERITKNYRNSREILRAAYEVLKNNLTEDMFESTDLEILDPRYASFSGPLPVALCANSLEEEIAYALRFAGSALGRGTKNACMAFAGYSCRDIAGFARKYDLVALDGTYDPGSGRLVLCDLEQSKGYEFDLVIILNCCDSILPPNDAPSEEAYRASCKLYVAMTRAKKELILSFHGRASRWITEVADTIGSGQWSDFEELDLSLFAAPDVLPELDVSTGHVDIGALTGLEFLFTSYALGITPETQDKLVELVDGRGLRQSGERGGRRLKWRDMRSLYNDLDRSSHYDVTLGPARANEIRAMPALIGTAVEGHPA